MEDEEQGAQENDLEDGFENGEALGIEGVVWDNLGVQLDQSQQHLETVGTEVVDWRTQRIAIQLQLQETQRHMVAVETDGAVYTQNGMSCNCSCRKPSSIGMTFGPK
jgi:hypothetical protein